MSEHTPFLTIFPGCADLKDCCGGLGEAYVTDVAIDEEERTLAIGAHFAAMPSMGDIAQLTERIRHDYVLSGVSIAPEYPRPKLATAPAVSAASRPGDAPKSDVIFGKAIKAKPVEMRTLSMDSGKVTVEGDVIAVDSLSFTVMETPGHTPGSVTLLCAQGEEKVLFTGDTLFRDSCGRTDFPGSSTEDMLRSLKRLAELPGDYEVYPGHSFFSTLSRERSVNYFVKAALRQ